MAHEIKYKRPAEILSYLFDYTELLPVEDTILDTNNSYLDVTDSAGDDKKKLIVKGLIFDGKTATANLADGVNGEDYTINFYGVGDVTKGNPTPNRILELRVRSKIAGNV